VIWETTSYVSKYETESNRELDDLRKEFHEISVVDVYLFVELALRLTRPCMSAPLTSVSFKLDEES